MIYDFDTAECLARSPVTALSAGMRLRGMIGRDFSPEMDAMIFPRCSAVHTFFMRIELDVLFLDASGIVVGVARHLPPWRPWAGARHAAATVEFPAGTLRNVEPGHRILLNEAPDRETAQTMRRQAMSETEMVN